LWALALAAAAATTGCNTLIGAGAPEEGSPQDNAIDKDPPGSPAASVCGNNALEAGEECDDGNDDASDGCVQCVLCGLFPEHLDDRTGHCYLVEGEVAAMPNGLMEGMTWEAANTDCEAWGGTLVVVSSADEHNLLQHFAMHFADKMSQDLSAIDFWVGATKTGPSADAVTWVVDELADFEVPWTSNEEASEPSGGVALDGSALGFAVEEDPSISLPYFCERVPAGNPAGAPTAD
jgi:cysteine-rich repeat protein